MSERKHSSLIKDMIICIDHIQQYYAGLSFDAFTADYMRVEACCTTYRFLAKWYPNYQKI